MYLSNNTNKTLIALVLYFSLLIGFYFGENTSGGAYDDFIILRIKLIESFKNDFIATFLSYNDFGDRHSPLLMMLLSFLSVLGIEIDVIRFIHLNILPLLILMIYKCLILKFPNIDKKIIFLICCVFFLSPSIRSTAIWPDSRLIGLLIFVFSIYFFLNFKKNHSYKNCIYSNLFLVLSAYFSPNFSVFFLYYFFYYFKIFNISQKLIAIFLMNIFLSLPMIIYLFYFDINFLSIKVVSHLSAIDGLNPSNKIFIISTLIFFYMLPFIYNQLSVTFFKKNFKIKHLYFSTIIFFLLLYFFDYSINYTGGGIFFKISYLLFDNSYLFFCITFLSFLFITNIFKLDFNNVLLFFVLIISNPQFSIYHKYFDPLLIILFFLFFNFNFQIEKVINSQLVKNIYSFYLFLLLINFGRTFI